MKAEEATSSPQSSPLLPGIVTLAQWAAAVGVSPVTASRWGRRLGLPIIKRGHQRFVDVEKARAWLAKGERGGMAPPSRRRVAR